MGAARCPANGPLDIAKECVTTLPQVPLPMISSCYYHRDPNDLPSSSSGVAQFPKPIGLILGLHGRVLCVGVPFASRHSNPTSIAIDPSNSTNFGCRFKVLPMVVTRSKTLLFENISAYKRAAATLKDAICRFQNTTSSCVADALSIGIPLTKIQSN